MDGHHIISTNDILYLFRKENNALKYRGLFPKYQNGNC